MTDPKESSMESVVNMGKGILSVLKETASEKYAETKGEAAEMGEKLVDKLLANIKHIGFLLVAVLLVMVSAVHGLSLAFDIPIWASALGLGVLTYGAGEYYKKRSIGPSMKEIAQEGIAKITT